MPDDEPTAGPRHHPVFAWSAGVAGVAGLVLALHHPLHPVPVTAAWLLWSAASLRWPGLWLFVVPAAVPVMSFAPWTGWLIFTELDLVVLGAIVGGYAALARRAVPAPAPFPWLWPLLLCASWSAFSMWRGLAHGGATPGWFDGPADPLNGLHLFKSLLFAVWLGPLLALHVRHDAARATRHLCIGMVAGLALASLAAAGERAAYPGLWDFSLPYRSVGLFWEMRLGGAAIDAYMALALPFAAWALWTARTWWAWVGAALLGLLAEYAFLTTFSRGLYLAIAVEIVWVVLAVRRQGHAAAPRWRHSAARLLGAVMLIQAVVIAAGSFMSARLAESPRDLSNRLAHWQRGITLLQGPGDWLLGRGLGRYPALNPEPFPGAVALRVEGDRPAVEIAGPRDDPRLAGLFALTQRVALVDGMYVAELDVRVVKPVAVSVSVCELHLLHVRRCQRAGATVEPPAAQEWQHVVLPLHGAALSRDGPLVPRLGAYAVAVAQPGASLQVRSMILHAPGHPQLLRNADFAQGMAGWFPAARQYFMPWHIDSLYLEWLIEQGLVGLALFAASMALVLHRLVSRGDAVEAAPFIGASLCGALVVGLVSSIMDSPRVAMLMLLLAVTAWHITTPSGARPSRT